MDNFTSGHYVNQGYYRSFQPEFVNRKWNINNMEILSLLSQADRQMGRLDMYSEYIPNIDLFISMHVIKEATQSNKIEGTKTNLEEALLGAEEIEDEKRDDWEEIQNYIEALNVTIEDLKKIPLSTRLFKKAHQTLMKGVRREHKLPGELRTSQNWVGGASIQDAIYIPPYHHTLNDYMGDLENFIHSDEHYFPELLKIALIHYQFETIHPFLDGNGRLGRLMITLYLVEKGILKRPILYLSDFFSRNKGLYYDNLMYARTNSDLVQWFKFFLVGVIETAKNSVDTFDKVLKLQKEVEIKIQSLGRRAGNAQKVINYLFQKPILNASKTKSITSLSMPSSYVLIADLEKLGIIEEVTGAKRGKRYFFTEYIKLFY